MKPHRSKNPDLLFPDIVYDRSQRIIPYALGYKKGNMPRKLNRATLLITHRCNYLCKYCNGPHTGFNKTKPKKKEKMLQKDLSFTDFEKMVRDWSRCDLTHIHFTGGEPTLNRDLIKMVDLATKNGILTSITTNGSADISIYKDLIEKGMTEIRISLEADNKDDYNKIIGVKGYFQKVLDNINEIVRMRDEDGADIFLVLNTCVGEINFEKIEKLLRFLISLDPDDIKFLVVSMEREDFSKKQSQKFLDRLLSILDEFPKNKFVLLRDKIDKMFDSHAQGLKDERTKNVMDHCYIPVTERTMTATHYYPCSIYIRAFGKPLGKNTDSFEVQQKKIMDFVQNHDCREDNICNRICTNCCKLFNVYLNEKIKGLEEIKVDKEFGKKDIEKLKKKLETIWKHPFSGKDWFLIIKPFGEKHKEDIKNFLLKKGIKIKKEIRTNRWRDFAILLYRRNLEDSKLLFSLHREEAFRQIEGNGATILFLGNIPSGVKIKEMKEEMRFLFPAPEYILTSSVFHEVLQPNTFHIPDEKGLERENKVLDFFIK